MKKFVAIGMITYLSIVAAEVDLTLMPEEVKLQIISLVVDEPDFNRAFTNFTNLLQVNKNIRQLAGDKTIQTNLIAKVLHGDLKTVVQNLERLFSHPKFKHLTNDPTITNSLIEKTLPSKISAELDKAFAKSLIETLEKRQIISALLLGTPPALEYVQQHRDAFNQFINSMGHSINKPNWKQYGYLYRKIAKSVRSLIDPDEDPNKFFIFINYAIKNNDNLMLKIILEGTQDYNITPALILAMEQSPINCDKLLETIQLLLELSHTFDNEVIRKFDKILSKNKDDSDCKKIKTMLEDAAQEYQELSEPEELEELSETEERAAKKRKTS